MKVETAVPERKPDIVITLSWEEAKILTTIIGATQGRGRGRAFVGDLYGKLGAKGIDSNDSLSYRGGEFRGG